MKKAFLVVGHSNWGKSKTLKELTGGNRWVKYTYLNGKPYFVRRMSNDDNEDGLIRFIDHKALGTGCDLIIAFCPTFKKGEKGELILRKLSRQFELFFFVLKNNYAETKQISDAEIATLKTYGTVKIQERAEEAKVRAKTLLGFIKTHG